MSEKSLEIKIDDQYIIKLAHNLINSFTESGSNYLTIKNELDDALNKPIDIAITILNNDSDDCLLQSQIQSIKILPFHRLFEEIINYKKKVSLNINKMLENHKKVEPVIIQEDYKFKQIQQNILKTAKQSKSPRVKSFLNSVDENSTNVSIEKIEEFFLILAKEGEIEVQSRISNLLSNVQKIVNSKEDGKSMSVERSERLIIRNVQTLKDKVNELTEKSIKTNSTQLELIKTFQSQIEDLRVALQSKNDTIAFENDIKRHFENIENSLNSNKYEELFENYKEAFKKIEEVAASKNEVIVLNGKLETQNLLLKQKANDLEDENNKLKARIQTLLTNSPKSP